MSFPYISTQSGLTVALEGLAYTVPKTAPNYEDVRSAIVRGETDIDVFRKLLNIRDYIAQISEGRAELVDGALYFDGQPMRGALADRVAVMFAEGFGVTPLLRFMNRVAANPRMDKNSPLYNPDFENELYLFLESGECPITEDGKFLAYKMVDFNFRDIYTGTMDNSPGATVSLEKPSDVDGNRNNTCSRGLHFASLNYVLNGSYGSRGRGHRLVVVEIDPADVISIPYDYNNSKGRAWRYVIDREIEWNDRIKPNFIAENQRNSWNEPEEYDEDYEDYEDEDEDYDDSDEDYDDSDEDEAEEQVVTSSGVLTDDEVRGIRAALDRSESLAAIGRFYQVSPRTVARIRDGETYTYVK